MIDYMKYAGIGSRETPEHILALIEVLAENLGLREWTLRTGGAPGADSAFFNGAFRSVNSDIELYLPWDGFNGYHKSSMYGACYVNTSPSPEAYSMAEEYHPSYRFLKQGAKKLMARNSHQVFGANMDDPVDCVICWTPGHGGTTQAIRIAEDHNIPVFNLFDPLTLKLFSDIIAL
jgi:hypothetical protein